eukprot:15350914-Ditylum_brightwellii.AAC.1
MASSSSSEKDTGNNNDDMTMKDGDSDMCIKKENDDADAKEKKEDLWSEHGKYTNLFEIVVKDLIDLAVAAVISCFRNRIFPERFSVFF